MLNKTVSSIGHCQAFQFNKYFHAFVSLLPSPVCRLPFHVHPTCSLAVIFLILAPEQSSNYIRLQTLKNIVVFASGSGTNFQAVIDAVESGEIKARIRGLVASKPGIGALERARNHGIEHRILAPSDFETGDAYVSALLELLEKWNTDLIVLAGYMLKIPAPVIERYPQRIINIHPALLPKYGGKGFYGTRVHEAVLEGGEEESGCTVHYVTEEYDDGPIIAQKRVPVKEADDPETLAARVLEQEHRLLPKVVARLVEKG